MSFGQFDAGTDKTQFSAISFLIEQAMLKMQTVTLVKVIAVHSNGVGITGTVDVQPMVNQMQAGPNGTQTAIAHGTIYGVPFFRLQGGASAFICDPVAGDIGMCGFAARDISSVKQTRAVANPGSQRVYDWADGLYIGGFIDGVPTQYIQALAADGGWKIVSPGDLTVDVPLAEFTGDLVVDGDATVTGNTTLTGPVEASAGVTTTTVAAASAIFSGSVTASSFIGSGGGGGTVSSVDISSPGGTVSTGGGPITGAGTLTVDLPNKVTPGSFTLASITVDAQGRVTAAASGTGGSGTVTSVGLSASSFFTLGGTNPVTGSGTISIDLSSGFQASLAATAALAASALQSLPVTTKGDLLGYSTAPTRVPVGTNGQVLTADSTAPVGVSWQTPGGGGAVILALADGGGAVVTPSASGWTFDIVSGGSGTATVGANGQLVITLPTLSGSGAYYRKAYTNIDFDIRLYLTNPNLGGWGVFIRDSSTGNLVTVGSSGVTNATPDALNLTSAPGTTIGAIAFNSAAGSFGTGTAPLSIGWASGWFRTTRVGNAFTILMSLDGDIWISLGTVSSSFAASPDQFGLFFFGTGVYKYWSLSGI